MNHRERFFTALDLKEPDFVPLTDVGLDPQIVEGILSRETTGAKLASALATGGWQSSIDFRRATIEACLRLI